MSKRLLSASALLLCFTSAHASVIYKWQGDCLVGCTGKAFATMTWSKDPTGLAFGCTFLGYGECPLRDFTYRDSEVTYRYLGYSEHSWFTIPTSFYVNTDAESEWTSFGLGSGWSVEIRVMDADLRTTSEYYAGGNNGVFTLAAAPEPGMLALLGVGVAGIAFSRRKNALRERPAGIRW